MKYYTYSFAPNPRRVDAFLAEKRLDIPTVTIDLRAGAQFAADFLAVNPRATVPCLALDDGLVIAETMAICRYLEARHPEPCLFGATPGAIADIETWNRRAEIEGFLPAADALRNEGDRFRDRAVPGPRNYAQIPALVARGRARAEAFLDDLDHHLAGRTFVAAEGFSMADINAWVTVEFMARVRVVPRPEQAALRRWYAEIAARPSIAALPPAPPPA